MFKGNVNRLALKCTTLMLLILSLLVFSNDSTRALLASVETSQNRGKPPTVITESPDDAPLHVITTTVESEKGQDFRLRVMVQNQSTKNIRAYAITSHPSTEKIQNGYTQFINLTKREGVWRPTEIKTIEINDPRQEPIVSVRIAVDFVEFSDGTTWGPDTSNSRDTLAGQREGARAEKQRVRQLLRDGGRAKVVKGIEEDIAPIDMPGSNRSPEWLNGFRSGSRSIRNRLKETLRFGDSAQLERELSKPFDTSEDN